MTACDQIQTDSQPEPHTWLVTGAAGFIDNTPPETLRNLGQPVGRAGQHRYRPADQAGRSADAAEYRLRKDADKPSRLGANKCIRDDALLMHIRVSHSEVKGGSGWPKIWKNCCGCCSKSGLLQPIVDLGGTHSELGGEFSPWLRLRQPSAQQVN